MTQMQQPEIAPLTAETQDIVNKLCQMVPFQLPSHVDLGSVGYYSKTTGEFVTLFNAFEPFKLPSGLVLPSLFADSEPHVRDVKRIQFKLELFPCQKAAHASAKSTAHSRIDHTSVVKEWFQEHADAILEEYGDEHQITREDLSIVYATRSAEDYVILVSHSHDECTFVFDVYPERAPGKRWGKMSVNYGENLDIRFKISDVRNDESKVRSKRGDTLMLVRFGFEKGSKDPVTFTRGL